MKKQVEIRLSDKDSCRMVAIPYDEVYLSRYDDIINCEEHIILVERFGKKPIYTVVPANMFSPDIIADIIVDHVAREGFLPKEMQETARKECQTACVVNEIGACIQVKMPFYVDFYKLDKLCRAICRLVCVNNVCSVSIKTLERHEKNRSILFENEKETQVEIIVYNESVIFDNKSQ